MDFVEFADRIYKRIGYGYLGLTEFEPQSPLVDDTICQQLRTHCSHPTYQRRAQRTEQAQQILRAVDKALLKRAQQAERQLSENKRFEDSQVGILHQIKLINMMYALRRQLDKEMKLGGASMLGYAITTVINESCQQREVRMALSLQRDRFVFQRLSARILRFIEAYLSMPGMAKQKQLSARRIKFETTQLQHDNTMTGTQKQVALLKLLFKELDFLRGQAPAEVISLVSLVKNVIAKQTRRKNLSMAACVLPNLATRSFSQFMYQCQQFADCFAAWHTHASVVVDFKLSLSESTDIATLLSAHTQWVEGISAPLRTLFSVQPCVMQDDCIAFLSQPRGSKYIRFLQQMITQVTAGLPYSETLSDQLSPILKARMCKISKAKSSDIWHTQVGLPIHSASEANALASCF